MSMLVLTGNRTGLRGLGTMLSRGSRRLKRLLLNQQAFGLEQKLPTRRGGSTPDRGLTWPHGSGLRFERDDDVSRFGLVRLQAIRIGLAPVGKIYNFGPRSSRPSGAGGLHDAESVAVEEKCMLPEYVVQLRNHGVVVGNRLTLQLAQGS